MGGVEQASARTAAEGSRASDGLSCCPSGQFLSGSGAFV
jgi:hypothetical protein